MIDAAIDSIAAWNQMIFIIGGLFMVGIGALILYDFARWRLRAQRFTGTITGLRMKGPKEINSGATFYPIIEYKNAEGIMVEGNTLNSSSILTNKIPGKEVNILVMPTDPGTVKIKGHSGLLFSALFLLPGLALWGIALRNYEVTIYTWIFGTALLLWGGIKISKIIKPREEWETVSEFQQRKQKEREEKRKKMAVLDKTEVMRRLGHRDKGTLKWAPLYIVISLAVFGLGVYLGHKQYSLESVGLRTEGEVIRIESEYNESSEGSAYTYYPVVEFQNGQERKVTFRSKSGSNPPRYQNGNIVTVLYDPDNEERAMIDHGIWNWSWSAALTMCAILLLVVSIKSYKGARERQIRRN